MSKSKTIMIDDVEYIRKSDAQASIEGDVKIVILQRGWIFVGIFERDGSDCKLRDASIIRRWGTENKGLGEIAKNGPTAKTVLDKANGLVQFDYLTVVAMVDCDRAKWESAL